MEDFKLHQLGLKPGDRIRMDYDFGTTQVFWLELVAQIDRTGKTDEPIYYQERIIPWDYRWFDLDCMNGLLKGEIELIEEGYASFWE